MKSTAPHTVKTMALAILLLSASATLWADDAPDDGGPAAPAAAKPVPAKPGRGAASSEVTDAQVVASMQKGIDYLLSTRKVDNWEPTMPDHHGNGEVGGTTSIAVYALLHAGDSLQDNPEYHAKLNWRGKELAPAVQWLSKLIPRDTYVAGLQASALTLVPKRKDEKPGEGTKAALEACKWYFLQGMGADGGYSYSFTPSPFPAAWAAYFMAAVKGNRAGPERTALDNAAKAQYHTYGGPMLELQRMAADLLEKKKAAKDSRETARIEAEMHELDAYMKETPQPVDLKKLITDAQKAMDALIQRNGNPSGLTTTDATTKKPRPMTRDELAAQIESYKTNIKSYETQLKENFDPAGDLSNGQYGTLGAWALADYGIELPNHYWEVQDRFWRLMQLGDGSWPYTKSNTVVRPAMGVAGIASLFIAQEFVDTELRLVPKPDKNIDAGLAWLAADFKPTDNFYYMYGVERVGLNSGFKFLGTTDWYKEGAAIIIKHQQADGSWSTGWGPTVSSSYALLFLARGRNPVVFNKLQYNGPWNARPRDDAYVTRWMSKHFERPINWQIVNLQVSPDEWMDAPVLLITGSVDPKFTKDDIEKLRTYINAGGMIFSTADGAKPAFTAAIKKVAAEVVHDKYEMRQLPKSHFLFSKEMGVDLPNPPPLLGMSNGSREIWIHSSQDVGADWQTRKFASKSFELGAALYFYSSGMASLRSKLQPLAVVDAAANPAHTVNLARIDYSGNADPEPGSWPRMAKLARSDFETQLNAATVKIADLDAKKFPLAHLTGTAAVTFTPDEVKSLKAYLEAGGLLFIDSAGGSAAFTASAQDLIKQLYPTEPLAPVPPDHPLFTGKLDGGEKIDEVEFRKYGNLLLKHQVTRPALEQIVIAGKTKILFSQWDICSGFLGTNTWGILGYTPASSEALARNILLYSLNPATAPEK